MLDLKAVVENAVVSEDKDLIEMAHNLEHIERRTQREEYIYTLGKALAGPLPVLDITKALRSAGCDPKKLWPRLAISNASNDNVYARILGNGAISFGGIVIIQDMVPIGSVMRFLVQGREWRADVPLIPASIRPDDITGYYIMWEPVWESVPKIADPYLLKYVNFGHCQIVASWNVTEVEIRAMRAARI